MSIYESYAKYHLLDEADDDDNASNTGGGQTIDLDAPDDTANDNADQGDNDANTDQNNDQQQDQNDTNNDQNNDQDDNQNTDDNQDQNTDTDTDFDINTGDDDDQTDQGGDDTGNQDANTDDQAGDDQKNEVENPEYDQIYANLSDKEKAIRDYQLRQNILLMHRTAGSMIEQLSLMPKISQTNEQIKILMTSLYTFRKFIIFYMKNTYNTKTLLENTIQYYKYMTIFGTYRDIFKELENIMAHPKDKEDK